MLIRLRPTEATRRHVADFLDLADDLATPKADAIRPIQDVIRATFAANFTNERGDDRSWAPLALRTIKERIRLGYGGAHPILIRSGDYRRSFVEADDPQHVSESEIAGGVWKIHEGTADIRAGTLEFGSDNVPARPVMAPGRSGEDRITEVVEYMFDRWFEEDQ